MAIKTFATYDRSDLRTMTVDELASLFNGRRGDGQALFRNSYGGLVELHVDLSKHRFKAYSVEGGVFLGEIDDFVSVVVLLDWLEHVARSWTVGVVSCADCGGGLRRFSEDIAGRYMAGTYCANCWKSFSHLKESEVD
jgi:hypothetical protein